MDLFSMKGSDSRAVAFFTQGLYGPVASNGTTHFRGPFWTFWKLGSPSKLTQHHL